MWRAGFLSVRKSKLGMMLSMMAALTVVLGNLGSPIATKASSGETSKSSEAQVAPQATCPSGGQCFADVTSGNSFYDFINRIFQQDLVSGYACGGAGEPCDASSRPYYRPNNTVTRQQMAKFIDNARRLPGIDITTSGGTTPITARNDTGTAIAAYSTSGQAFSAISQSQLAIYAQTGNATAIYGYSTSGASGVGVYGSGEKGIVGESSSTTIGSAGVVGNNTASTNGVGILGTSGSLGVQGTALTSGGIGVAGTAQGALSTGVFGSTSAGYGVQGNTVTGIAVAGFSTGSGKAGYFSGDVQVTGNLSKGAGSFKIDDPIDPANKYLYHSFVESPDMMNVYNGNVTLDAKGEATVVMADWFEALNRDYRYQLTAIGAPGPNLYIAEKVHGNTFKIAGGTPNTEVSWQVTGIRQDPYANAHRIPVEEDKAPQDQGKYLHPTEWGQPATNGIGYISPKDQTALQTTQNSGK